MHRAQERQGKPTFTAKDFESNHNILTYLVRSVLCTVLVPSIWNSKKACWISLKIEEKAIMTQDKIHYIINNYSPKWRWIVVDICRGAKRITNGPKSNFICENIATKAILFFFGCSEVNSSWLIIIIYVNMFSSSVCFFMVPMSPVRINRPFETATNK